MCEDLALVAALSGSARQARTSLARAWAVYGLLARSGSAMESRAYAELLRIPLERIEFLLAALRDHDVVTADGDLAARWRVSRDSRDSHSDNVTVTDIEARRAADRERQERCRARQKAKGAARLAALDGIPAKGAAEPLPDSVTVTVTDPLEEERIIPLSSQSARPRDERAVKREALMHGALEEARRLLQPGQYQTLLNQMTERGRYERYLERGTSAFPAPIREFFEKLFGIMKQERQQSARAGPPRSHTEPEFLLPMKRSA
jgi:hypothetical protein